MKMIALWRFTLPPFQTNRNESVFGVTKSQWINGRDAVNLILIAHALRLMQHLLERRSPWRGTALTLTLRSIANGSVAIRAVWLEDSSRRHLVPDSTRLATVAYG